MSLEATVSVDEKAVDLAGDIVEITSLKPLIIKSGVGRITLWSKIKQEGAIENHIYINKSLCPHEYVPNLGDEIFYEAIESDQGKLSSKGFFEAQLSKIIFLITSKAFIKI